jgi:hypothetical protein
LNNPCFAKAAAVILSNNELWNIRCGDCQEACDMPEFIVTNSALKAAFQWQYDALKRFVENSTVPLPNDWNSTWKSHIHDNYVGVHIVWQTPIIEESTESPTMSVGDVLGNIGGQTGLWIGISFLSIMELIEMLLRLLYHEYQCIKNRCFPEKRT